MAAEQDRREQLLKLARRHGTPAIDLTSLCLDLSVLDLLPKEIADRHGILPLLVVDDQLLLAMVQPTDKKVIDELEFVTGKTVVPHVALEKPLRRLIEHVYSVKARGAQFFTGPKCPPEQTQIDGVERLLPCIIKGDGEEKTPDSLDNMPALSAGGTPGFGLDSYVLVVDDDESIRKLMERILAAEGHAVRTACDGAEALEILRQHMPKLLVTDAHLPQVHGFELVRRLRGSERYAALPVVIVSAVYQGWRFAHDMQETCGVRHFVEKPFTREALLDAVRAELGQVPREDDSEAAEEYQKASRAYDAGRIDDAVRHLEQGVQKFPRSPGMHVQLALLYSKKGLIYEAIAALERAVHLDDGHFLGVRNLAIFYQQAGFRNKATEMWMRALNLAPEESAREHIKNHLISML